MYSCKYIDNEAKVKYEATICYNFELLQIS